MATAGANKPRKGNDPMKTRRGKTRLGPLGVAQLEEMLSKSKGKARAKIDKALADRRKTQATPKAQPASEAAPAEPVSA